MTYIKFWNIGMKMFEKKIRSLVHHLIRVEIVTVIVSLVLLMNIGRPQEISMDQLVVLIGMV